MIANKIATLVAILISASAFVLPGGPLNAQDIGRVSYFELIQEREIKPETDSVIDSPIVDAAQDPPNGDVQDDPPPVDEETAPLDADQSAAPAPEPVLDEKMDFGPDESAPAVKGSDWLDHTKVGYSNGFVIASDKNLELGARQVKFSLRFNGWGQIRQTRFDSRSVAPDLNQFQLKRGRLIFASTAFTPNFRQRIQLDGRSSSGDQIRMLDYFLSFDIGRELWNWERNSLVFITGKYKMPFHMARYLSGRELEFADRSMASTFFDVNRSLAWGLYGSRAEARIPFSWEVAIFNGLVTGGAETGSSGTLDNNFAYSARWMAYPTGDWGNGQLADFDGHCRPATRIGMGIATTTINSQGETEFEAIRVVDSGRRLSDLFFVNNRPVDQYSVLIYSIDASLKYYGWSWTVEYYFRNINQFEGDPTLPDLFDHGYWLQAGRFVIPQKLQLLARWSRIVGNSGTLGVMQQSSDEMSGGLAWYFNEQHAKLILDGTYLNGASVNSSSLDINPGNIGWLFRLQAQFSF